MATPGHEGSPSHDGYDEHNVIFSTQTNSVNDNDCVTIKRKILSQKLFNEIYDAQRPPSQISVIKAFCKSKTKSYCMKNFYFQRCIRLFPFISVLYHYKWKVDITYDLIAGLTVGVMNIPQGLFCVVQRHDELVHLFIILRKNRDNVFTNLLEEGETLK